jgi:hypothetical protein
MNTTHKSASAFVVAWVAILLLSSSPGFAQVSPAEILNPRLKAIEQAYLTRLTTLNGAVAKVKFPFNLSLSRYAALDPKDQLGADARGLEFVHFHERFVLKLTANYNAAFNAELLTPNQRASRVFGEVVAPILELLPTYFSPGEGFDAFGFEIAYHVRRKTHDYEYEGKEILVVVLDKTDALSYVSTLQDSKRQEVLNRSEVYLNGKPFGLALAGRDPFPVEALERSVRKQHAPVSNQRSDSTSTDEDERKVRAIENRIPLFRASSTDLRNSPARPEVPVSKAAPTRAEAEVLQRKYQSQLDAFVKEGAAKLHFVDYAPPSFVVLRDQLFLQVTLRNPQGFDKEVTSIYKRAAQSFDLFLAPQLKSVLEKVPDATELGGLDITIVNDFTSKAAHSSEALEFICPIKALRRFAAAEITNQDLINQSLVLINGVRIALNLQQVE